jgi:hypothetical protein
MIRLAVRCKSRRHLCWFEETKQKRVVAYLLRRVFSLPILLIDILGPSIQKDFILISCRWRDPKVASRNGAEVEHLESK